MPDGVWEAFRMLKACPGMLAAPQRLLLKWTPGRKWPEILDVELGAQGPIDEVAIEEAKALAEIGRTLFK